MRIVAVWAVLAAAYILFAGSFGLNEAAAGAASAALATLWWREVAWGGGMRFAISSAGLGFVACAAAGVPAQTARIAARLARACLAGDVAGSAQTHTLTAMRWPDASAEDRHGAGSRALAALAASLAPDSFVLRLERAKGTVVLHALDDGSRSKRP